MAKILIIDDDPRITKLLSMQVCHSGHQAACASTLEAGIAEASSDSYDIVFLDVRLPDGNGLDALPQ